MLGRIDVWGGFGLAQGPGDVLPLRRFEDSKDGGYVAYLSRCAAGGRREWSYTKSRDARVFDLIIEMQDRVTRYDKSPDPLGHVAWNLRGNAGQFSESNKALLPRPQPSRIAIMASTTAIDPSNASKATLKLENVDILFISPIM